MFFTEPTACMTYCLPSDRRPHLGRYRTSVNGNMDGGSRARYCMNYIGGRSFSTLDRDYDYYSGGCERSVGMGQLWKYFY